MRLSFPVEHPVLNRFADMDGADGLGIFEVGDGAGNFKDPGVGAGAQSQAPECRLQQGLGVIVPDAITLDQFL